MQSSLLPDLPDSFELDICAIHYSDGVDNPGENVRILHENGYFSDGKITSLNPTERDRGGVDSENLSLAQQKLESYKEYKFSDRYYVPLQSCRYGNRRPAISAHRSLIYLFQASSKILELKSAPNPRCGFRMTFEKSIREANRMRRRRSRSRSSARDESSDDEEPVESKIKIRVDRKSDHTPEGPQDRESK